jgi:HSP20 family molecular chaperone IbpA
MRRNDLTASPVQRWQPSPVQVLEEQIGQLVEQMLSDTDVWAPPVDIEESEDAWIVEAEPPGIDGKDVDVLTVRIPKPEVARPRHVEVRRSHNGQAAAQPQQSEGQPAQT